MRTSILRPGLMVSLRTSVRGNVQYNRRDLESRTKKDGSDLVKWETERVIADRAEHEAATKAQSAAGAVIRRVCAKSAFGLLCPKEKEADLDAAIKDAEKIAEDFNATAKLSRLDVHVMTGEVAQDDVKAVKAINKEIRELMEDMQEGLKNLDVKSVREAANKATSVGKMLSDKANDRVKIAIDAARSAARKISKAGDNITVAIDNQTIEAISRQRTSFLDLDDAVEVEAPKAQVRTVDMGVM